MRNAQRKLHATSDKAGFSPARLLLLLAGIVLVFVFIQRTGASEVRAQLLRVGPSALWMLVPYAVGTAIGALPWGVLLPSESRPSVSALVQSRFAASGANSILPFFGVAGEPSRLLWLDTPAHANGVAAIVIDRVLYNAANGSLLLLGAALAWLATGVPKTVAGGAVVIALLTLAVTVAAFWLVSHQGIGRRIQRLLRRLLGERYAEADFGGRVDAALLKMVRGPSRPLVQGGIMHLLGKAAMVVEVHVGLWCLGAEASVAQTFVLAVVPIALSFFFSSVPSQVGVQEGAQTFVAGSLGLNPALVLSLVLLQRFRQLAFAALLPILLATARARELQRSSRSS